MLLNWSPFIVFGVSEILICAFMPVGLVSPGSTWRLVYFSLVACLFHLFNGFFGACRGTRFFLRLAAGVIRWNLLVRTRGNLTPFQHDFVITWRLLRFASLLPSCHFRHLEICIVTFVNRILAGIILFASVSLIEISEFPFATIVLNAWLLHLKSFWSLLKFISST